MTISRPLGVPKLVFFPPRKRPKTRINWWGSHFGLFGLLIIFYILQKIQKKLNILLKIFEKNVSKKNTKKI